MIRAIITDLDGTILPRGGNISPATYEAFAEVRTKRLSSIIATGRNLYAALKVLPLDLPIDYLIFSSGAGLLRWNDRKILFAQHLQQDEARKIAGYLWDFNINFTIQREIPDNHHFYYTALYPQHEDYKRRLETYAPFGSLISSPLEICSQATQFVVILDPRQLRLLEQIRHKLKGYSVVRSTSPFDNRAIWLEIFAPEIDKGHTCCRLVKGLGIEPAACAGLGNDYNDIDFLDICGKAYVVSNAPVNLKKQYPQVKADKEEGFAEFIRKVI